MVKLVTTTQELIHERNREEDAIGFVPTMGNLHAGHISLLEQALKDFKNVYFSIFVNPKQFGPNEDFERYPRTLTEDLNIIRESVLKFPGSSVLVYAPHNVKEVFPTETDQTISVTGLSEILEGEIRPGHFQGVATVVHRLFDIVKPQKAYFGLKDYQQYIVIKQMVKDLHFPIEIIGMPIIRELSQLALSSRNQYLSHEQKKEALTLYRGLKEIETVLNNSRTNLGSAQTRIKQLMSDKRWNYLEIRDAETLSSNVSFSKKITILAVYQLGTTRLLDNLQVEMA